MDSTGWLGRYWKLLAVAGVGVLGVWALAPRFVGSVAPVLLIAICPLSMLLMMRGMRGGDASSSSSPPAEPTSARPVGAPSDGRIAELKSRLSELQAGQDEVAREIARLEGHSEPDGGALASKSDVTEI